MYAIERTLHLLKGSLLTLTYLLPNLNVLYTLNKHRAVVY